MYAEKLLLTVIMEGTDLHQGQVGIILKFSGLNFRIRPLKVA